ncbi:interleukin-21 receptor [Ambystoma mexicanum]|uniref:interleukin-21 receptor n=1 Tax=Ambystoma mexicanum TaxID=8296 RepID=UPI0037E860A6
MKRSREIQAVLLLCLGYGIMGNSASCEELHCYVDLIETVTCTYKEDDASTEEDMHELHATWCPYDKCELCILSQSAKRDGLTTYTCHMSMLDFSAADTISINMTSNIGGRRKEPKACGEFIVGEIFMPYPPVNLSVATSDGYNFSWNTLYECQQYFMVCDELEYELSYKKKDDPWQSQRSVGTRMDRKHVILLLSAFQTDTEYVSRVRAKPRATSEYKGSWSEWSPLLTWKTEPDDASRGKSPLLKSWLPVVGLVLLTVLVFTYCHVPQRLWKKMAVVIPNPAVFFKPLYMGHDGDFKSWLGTSYTLATKDLFDWGVSVPDVVEVCSLHRSTHSVKVDQTDMEEGPKQNVCLSGLGADGQEHTQCLLPCSRNISNLGVPPSYAHVSSNTEAEVDENASLCPHVTSFSNETYNSAKKDGYPAMDFGDHMSDLYNDLTISGSLEQEKIKPSNCIESVNGGTSCAQETMVGPLTSLLGPNMSVLDLLLMPADAWGETPGPALVLSQDDDSVCCNEVPEDSFSSNSESGATFGYPRICLDLDTMDSGFADSDCGSPVERDFGKAVMAKEDSTLNSESIAQNEGVPDPWNYVKQWMSNSPTIPTGRPQQS